MAPEPPELPHPFPRPPKLPSAPWVAPGELAEWQERAEPPVLLDIRSAAERSGGHLPGDQWIPLAELPRRRGEIPRGRSVVVYDRNGGDAPAAARLLGEAGIGPLHLLAGGAEAYARDVDPSIGRYDPDFGGPVGVVQMPRPETGCLAYLLGDPRERRAILIDPGLQIEPYLARLKEGGWTLEAIVETHTHADHLAGHAALHERTGAPIWVSHRSPAAYPHRTLSEGSTLEAGSVEVVAYETPGHTRDHLTLKLGPRVFTGDTLLIGACGRSDLGDGDPVLLYESLHGVLGRFPDEVEVYPAHYGPRHALPMQYRSTLGVERATNEALRIVDREGFVKYMTEGWPPKPAEFERIVAANLADGAGGA